MSALLAVVRSIAPAFLRADLVCWRVSVRFQGDKYSLGQEGCRGCASAPPSSSRPLPLLVRIP